MAVISKWRPPQTVDDYMCDVQMSLWYNERERAKRQLLWLMEMFMRDEDEKTYISKIRRVESEAGEDDNQGATF